MRALLRCSSGLAATEFALVLPVMVTLGFGGLETANYVLTTQRINQTAIQIADNASRAKQAVLGAAPVFREYDMGEVFRAAELARPGMDVYGNGRVIVSSLETNASGGQWLHWQRCRGNKVAASRYGVQGTGATGTAFAGMGPSGSVVTAEANSAVIFVEVYYDYTPVTGVFSKLKTTIYRAAAMVVRDDRDLTQIANPSPAATVYSC